MSFYNELRETIEEIDGITKQFSRDLTKALEAEFGPTNIWVIEDLDKIQPIVDEHISTTYGSTRGSSRRSRIYNSIYSRVYFTGNRSYDDFFRDLNSRLNRYDRNRWGRIRSMLFRRDNDPLAGAFASLRGPVPAAERSRRARMFDPNRRWVSTGGYRLSDRVWRTGRLQRRAIDKILRDGIRRGQGVATISRKLDKYLNPDHAAVVYRRNGQIVRRHHRAGGEGAYSARRLARTELQRANATATREATRHLSTRVPGTGLTYSLSPAHPKIDICDFHASNNTPGFPAGTYRVEDAPMIPQHPQCLCHYRPYTVSIEEILDFLEQEYGAVAA